MDYKTKDILRAPKSILKHKPVFRKLISTERTPMELSSILIILLVTGGVQARPLFDFLPPVIIDENQQISILLKSMLYKIYNFN